jgi:hypothetical protein
MMLFKIREIHQIEMTSHCNLRCRYCTHPNLKRPKMHMTPETYAKALRWARMFVVGYGQRSLNLAGIGESTMHPDFVRNVHLAREAVGPGCELVLATNGIAVTEEMIKGIASAKPNVFVSMHRPEKAGPAVELCRKHGVFAGASSDPTLAATNWAGQVKWHVSVPNRRRCMWVMGGLVMVMADGRVTRCSYDASGAGVICTVDDDLRAHATSAYSLCAGCDQDVGVPLPEAEAVA